MTDRCGSRVRRASTSEVISRFQSLTKGSNNRANGFSCRVNNWPPEGNVSKPKPKGKCQLQELFKRVEFLLIGSEVGL